MVMGGVLSINIGGEAGKAGGVWVNRMGVRVLRPVLHWSPVRFACFQGRPLYDVVVESRYPTY